MATARPDFVPARGAKDIETEASKDRADFSSSRPTILKWDGDPSRHIVRFLDDDSRGPDDDRKNVWIGIKRHFVKTADEPKSFKGKNWPKGMNTTCRYAPAFNGHFTDCPPCDQSIPTPDGRVEPAKMRVFARAVLRERVLWTGTEPEFADPESDEYKSHTDKWRARKKGKLRGVVDMTREVPVPDKDGKPTNKRRTVPQIVLIDQSNYLFFQHLSKVAQNRLDSGVDAEDYTILDRDFLITKTGKEQKTSFGFEAIEGSDELVGEPGQTVEVDGEVVDLEDVVWDVRNPDVLAYYEQFIEWDVNERLVDEAMDEHVYKWLVKGGWDDYADDNDSDTDEDDEEEEKPKRRRSSTGRKAAQRRGPAAVEDDDDDEDEGDPDDEDSPLARQKAKMRAEMEATEQPTRQRRDSSPKDDEDDDSEDEDADDDADDKEFAEV